MSEEVELCPFCGKLGIATDYELGRYWRSCRACGAMGPTDPSESGATEKWITRPIEDALRARAVELEAALAACQAEAVRLREALKKIANRDNWMIAETDTGYLCSPDWQGESEPMDIARAALESEG